MSDETRFEGKVEKTWGHELIFATNELYCGKLLHFSKAENRCSMHFHKEKDETWFVLRGSFIIRILDTSNAKISETTIREGQNLRIPPLVIHQIEALEDESTIIEVSSPDSVEDNYRVWR